MLKIGIITHYYNSTNYGGNLQAYALCAFLNKLGHQAVQISYDRSSDYVAPQSFVRSAKRFLRKSQQTVLNLPQTVKNASIKSELEERTKAVLAFNQEIPHTEVYNFSSISSCVEDFDLFITGSDQVWNPMAVCNAYLLDFVDSGKAFKMSYAASISALDLPENLRQKYKNSLKDYLAVSVRENDSVSLIQPLVDHKVECVLDPTLLLDAKDWESVVSDRVPAEPYAFCYFLGNSDEQRKTAAEYCRKHGLKTYTIPYLNGAFRACDKNFGDCKLFDVSPEDFLALIKNASCIFTDSFHAVVFSLLFEKQFFVFDRIIGKSLGSRIENLTELFGAKERFCNTSEKISVDYIDKLAPVNYNQTFSQFLAAKEKSVEYLVGNLAAAEKEMK